MPTTTPGRKAADIPATPRPSGRRNLSPREPMFLRYGSEDEDCTVVYPERQAAGRCDRTEGDDADAAVADTSPPPSPAVSRSAEEIEWLEKRDGRIAKRIDEADREWLRGVTALKSLTRASGYRVVCYGVALRCRLAEVKDEHADLYHSPMFGDREERQAALAELEKRVCCTRRAVGEYDAWVLANRPELARDEFLTLLAGTKDERAAVKAHLARLDRTSLPGPAAKPTQTNRPDIVKPAIYRDECRGKVRAYPAWVAPVLRAVVRKPRHAIPAMAFVLAQLAYWQEPADESGRPRAKRAKLIGGKWWVVLGYGQIEKQTPVSKGQARRAMAALKRVNLVQKLTAADADVDSDAGGVDYGPNTVFLRVNTEVLDPLVEKLMSVNPKSGFEK